ncbi:helix-turn-helix domain containing protein [Mycobacterium sp. Aquia_216]|uniref:helix-turn-helix domain-containing protein n=1 Tax=Mycobacterium sp. Aquia_216 TaxID=2991729 RepID=UPI00227C3390|nr:helix-turn-helix domain-containing protein [Mycobacterium sp. Aquia_216]WAJ43413.1 helix-turn-helix domain containing protein [Mycobacterium sp. Aquia_216]
MELFTQHGYDSVGMEEIAHASMCSRSTLNRHFGAEEDVLFPRSSLTASTTWHRHERPRTANPFAWNGLRPFCYRW